MSPDIAIVDPITGAHASWSVYLLAPTGDAAFKVGFTTHPLQRLCAFSSRFYERFDFSRSRLLTVTGLFMARELELTLKHRLADHRRDPPSWVPTEAGGHTEWFAEEFLSDAQSHLLSSVGDNAAMVDLRDRLADDLRRMTGHFETWAWRYAQQISEAWEAAQGGWPAPIEAARALRDWLDAFRYFEIDLFEDDLQVRDFIAAAARRKE